MTTSSTPQVVFRLVPVASRASSIVAAGFSLALHGGVVALAMGLGQETLRPHTPPRYARPAPIVRFLTLGPKPSAPMPASLPTRITSRAAPISRSVPYEAPPALQGATRPFLAAPRLPPSELEEAIVDDRNAALAPAGVISTAAQLRGNPGDACPEIRRPGAWTDSRDMLAVAVAFVVDSSGAIDPATMRVVQAPGRPALRTGFVPHIYTVSAAARIDRSLPHEVGAFGAIVADDVLNHVARLRFRPGLLNGRPAQSMVLISCQVS